MRTYQQQYPPLVIVVAVVSIAILIILIIRPGEPAQRMISHWSPEPMITRPDVPIDPLDTPPPISGALIPVDDTFDLQVSDGLYDSERDALTDEIQRAVAYASNRFGASPNDRFTVSVIHDESCGMHGLAYTDVRNIQVYTCPNISRNRAVAILAHEIVHQLEHDYYGPAHLHTDLILSEGMATWGAGEYWLNGHADFRSFVDAQRQGGLFYPLATHYSGLGIAAMNALYYQWASFVEFLIQTYGRESFDQLYITGQSNPGSADYVGVYGKSLEELEQEWISWIDR